MTIKAKWEKLHLGTSNIYTWVFVRGKMFVIGGNKFQMDKVKAAGAGEDVFTRKEKRSKL